MLKKITALKIELFYICFQNKIYEVYTQTNRLNTYVQFL